MVWVSSQKYPGLDTEADHVSTAPEAGIRAVSPLGKLPKLSEPLSNGNSAYLKRLLKAPNEKRFVLILGNMRVALALLRSLIPTRARSQHLQPTSPHPIHSFHTHIFVCHVMSPRLLSTYPGQAVCRGKW